MRKSDQIIHAIKMILGVYIFICTSPFTYVFGVCVLCPNHAAVCLTLSEDFQWQRIK
jgi:hypothetical protein